MARTKIPNRICEESMYFKAVCTGGFSVSITMDGYNDIQNELANALQESGKRTITLPESDQTIAVLLDEIYSTYNSTTGSLFTGFVLRSEIEKERVLNDLLDLFIAADKVSNIATLIQALS